MIFGNRSSTNQPDDYERARETMVSGLEHRIDDPKTLAALRAVPRHEFVPEHQRDHAYEDRPLPIENNQTISAPHMVGIMTDYLTVTPGDTVLEIGTGCGYHAAVTAEIVGADCVYSAEVDDELATNARQRLANCGYSDISIAVTDGREGWPENAPYDAIYVTCAPTSLPDPLLSQVKPGGQVLAPIGTESQSLVSAEKQADGSMEKSTLMQVRFVPMRSGEGTTLRD